MGHVLKKTFQLNFKFVWVQTKQKITHIYMLGACVLSQLQLCPSLCVPMDYSPPGFSVHGILQESILKWIAVPSSRESSWSRDRTPVSCISCIAGGFFTHWATWEALYVE